MAGGDRHRADLALIEALIVGKTDAQAAHDAGVSERTVGRRRKDPEFAARLNAARAARYERLTDRVSDVVGAVIGRLGRYLIDDVNDPHMGMTAGQFHARRLQATGQLISMFFDARAAARDDELRLLQQQLQALEAEVATFRELFFEGSPDGHRDAASTP